VIFGRGAYAAGYSQLASLLRRAEIANLSGIAAGGHLASRQRIGRARFTNNSKGETPMARLHTAEGKFVGWGHAVNTRSSAFKPQPALLFFLIFAGVILCHLPALTLIPAVNHDEAAINSAAQSWVDSGQIRLALLADVGRTYRTGYYWHPPGHLLVMAAAYRCFGYSIFVTRFESLFFGALGVALFFLLVRKVAGSTGAGLIGAMFLAGHPLWWWLCRSGRMDTTAISIGLAALLLGRHRPEEEFSGARAAAIGLLLGIGSLFYTLLLFWIPACFAAEMAARRRNLWRPAMLGALVGALPLLLWVAAVFALGHGDAWIEQFWKYQVLQRKASTPFLDRPWAEFRLFWVQMKLVPCLAAAALAGVWFAWRGIASEIWRWCAGGLTVMLLLVTFGMGKGTGAYPMYWFAWLACLSAAGWRSILGASGRAFKPWGWLLALGLGNSLALHVFWAGVGLYQAPARDPQRVDAFFRAHLPAGAVVVGPEDIWYAVEKAGASLRIWVPPDPNRYEFYVTHAVSSGEPPPGYHRVATLKDKMPLIFGKYFSTTPYSYDLWAASPRP
jgi:4-amino-4-deoxy-L-arabinose transferase-like glycosyltransferase